MSKTRAIQLTDALAAAFRADERAKRESRPEDNPFANHDLKRLTHGVGILKSADQHPARNMAEHGGRGYEMEIARNQGLKEGKSDKSAKRMAVARARAARKAQFDKIVDSPVQPSKQRMTEAWYVVFPLVPTIARIANSKKRWAARFLGDVMDDVAQLTLENMALLLAKSDKDLVLLRQAAEEIGDQAKKSGKVPGDMSEEERKERKALGKAKKWLMQVANNRVHSTLVDTYFRSQNLRWDNIDIIATVMASISGVGDDPLISRFKADRAPAFIGARFPRPGGVDPSLVATAINAAITARNLDRMVEVLLDEDKRRTDGAFKWSEHAEDVFMASPYHDGPWMWDMVCRSTEHLDRKRKARGDAARKYARSEFEWLPKFVLAVVEAMDPHPIGFAAHQQGGGRYILASDFELYYLPDQPKVRQMLQPKLVFDSADEAARALIGSINALMTGEEFVRSVVSE